MKSRGAVEHPLRHVPQAVLAHAEPHDARGESDGADYVLLLDGDSPDLLADLIVLLLGSAEPRPVELQQFLQAARWHFARPAAGGEPLAVQWPYGARGIVGEQIDRRMRIHV